MSRSKIGYLGFCLCMTTMANASTLSIGAGALIGTDPYLGVKTQVLPLPIINYEGNDFYVRSISAGYYLWRDEQNQLSLNAYLLPFYFKPSDSNNPEMQLLNRRRTTIMGGLSYSHYADWGIIRTNVAVDTLDAQNGFRGDLAYLHRFQLGDLMLVPGIGVSWNSSSLNHYYFGISESESQRTQFNAYSPQSSWSPYAEMTMNYALSNRWNAFLSSRVSSFSNEIKNSPMIGHSSSLFVLTGITYNF